MTSGMHVKSHDASRELFQTDQEIQVAHRATQSIVRSPSHNLWQLNRPCTGNTVIIEQFRLPPLHQIHVKTIQPRAMPLVFKDVQQVHRWCILTLILTPKHIAFRGLRFTARRPCLSTESSMHLCHFEFQGNHTLSHTL